MIHEYSREEIEEHFGPKLRSLGFVPYKDGFNWYKLKNGNMLFSIFFDEADINALFPFEFYALPLCTKLLYPLKNWKDRGLNMQCNYCTPVYYIWRYFNPLLGVSLEHDKPKLTDEEYLADKLNRYNLILDKLILPYFDSVNEPKDLVYFKDHEVVSVISYLYNDPEGFYKNTFTQRAFLFESEIPYDYEPEEYRRLRSTIHQAAKERDLSLIGKHLQEQEQQNIKYLKRRFPDLFNGDVKVEPFVTDELIKNNALTEIVEVTEDALDASVKWAEYHHPFNRLGKFIPFLNPFPNFVLTEESTKRNASELIASTFAEELKSYGLQPSEDMLNWTIQDDRSTKSVKFVCSPISPIISIAYGISMNGEDTLNDKTENPVCRAIAEHNFPKEFFFVSPDEWNSYLPNIRALLELQGVAVDEHTFKEFFSVPLVEPDPYPPDMRMLIDLQGDAIAERTFYDKYHFVPPYEPYPCPGDINALNEMQKKRIACLLKEIILPFLNN